MKEILTAIGIGLINYLSAIVIYHIAIKKEDKKFYKLLFSSIFFRYVINLLLFFICLKYLGFNAFRFTLTFFIATFFLIILEIIYFNSKSKLLILHNYKEKNE